MAAATGRSRVGDSGEVGQHVRGLGVLEFERVDRSESGEGGDDGPAGTGVRPGHEAVETA